MKSLNGNEDRSHFIDFILKRKKEIEEEKILMHQKFNHNHKNAQKIIKQLKKKIYQRNIKKMQLQ